MFQCNFANGRTLDLTRILLPVTATRGLLTDKITRWTRFYGGLRSTVSGLVAKKDISVANFVSNLRDI